MLHDDERVSFDVYFASLMSMQMHPGAGTKEHQKLTLEDCRDVVEMDLQDLIGRTLSSGFSREEVLIAISELVAEDFAAFVKLPSVH